MEKALERKKRLGQYAVIWSGDKPVMVGEDAPKESVSKLNVTDKGKPWLIDKQLDDLFEELTNQSGKTLLEANIDVLQRLYKSTVDKNELTGEE